MRKTTFNVSTGEVTTEEVNENTVESLEELKDRKQQELIGNYKAIIVQSFTSSATGVEVTYGYSQQDQLNYSKWANVFALDTTKESVIIGSVSDGVVTMTREQFLTFIRDAEAYEVGLYTKRKDLETQINNAVTVEELSSIVISL